MKQIATACAIGHRFGLQEIELGLQDIVILKNR